MSDPAAFEIERLVCNTANDGGAGSADGVADIEHRPKDSDNLRVKEKIIKEPYTYLSLIPGKDIRKQVLLACNVWLQVDSDSLETVLEVVSMLHNASLLVDDIEDGSRLRRGSPAAHTVYGIAQTFNSANYIYFKAQQYLMKLQNWPTAMQSFNEEMLSLHYGQGLDLYWRETLTVPSEEDYVDMACNKTGGLFRLGIRLMMLSSKRDLDLLPFTNLLGLLFQTQDDYRNLACDRMSQTKGYCDDITEGKFSFPIIHAIRQSETANNEILNILKLKTEDRAIKEHAVNYMRDVTKTFDYAKERLSSLRADALCAMEDLGIPNQAMKVILDRLVV